MAKFEKTLAGNFGDIAFNIEHQLTQNDTIILVDKVEFRNGDINCITMVFDKYNKYLEHKMSLNVTLFKYSSGCIRCVAIASGFDDVLGEDFGDEELFIRLEEIIKKAY